MKSKTEFSARGMLGRAAVLGFASLYALMLAVPLFAQNCPVNAGVRTICKQIGDAEAVSVTSPFGAYAATQPVVYWHDYEWKIDMLPQPTSDGELRMKITSRNGDTKIVNFPAAFFAQVDSISRNPGDKAIVIGEANGTSSVFSIVDLKSGKEISGGLLYHPSISPDRRFLLYTNWFPPHAESSQENLFTLYDTLKTPDGNICGYGKNNPEYKKNREALSGIQVYPNQGGCLIGNDESDDNQNVSNFIWSTDSSKVVFADIRGSIISLVLVKMLVAVKDHPQTLIYSFAGTENVCTGATYCDSNNIRSVAWDGDKVKVPLVQANPTGPAIVKNLTVPLSKFVPLTK